MKCALELVAIATVKADEIARAKAEKERAEREQRRIRTISYCTHLGEKLEAKAEEGKTPTITFRCTAFDEVLARTRSEYADKRESYYVSAYGAISLHDLCDWFADYCFDVKVETFHYYRYGWGYCEGKEVTISPTPACC